MSQLIFTKGDRKGERVALTDKPLLLGRSQECDILLHDALISSRHARLDRRGDAWVLTDLDSSNGTMLNGSPIRSVPVREGDLLTLGAEELIFCADDAATAEGSAVEEEVQLVHLMKERTDAIRAEVGKVIVGQTEVLDQILMVLLAGGHGLLVGMPGMAKTLMVSTLAKVLDMGFKRIQFTPDLMPSDITGTEILETNRDTNEKEFRFIEGPIFANLLLADEINRTPPKTQAALLEAMQEKRVTVGNKTYTLTPPFFVLATQNPIEQEGTYPLPEAQMDRFMFFIWVDYPAEAEEETIVATTTVKRLSQPERVLTREQVLHLQDVVSKIPVSDHVVKFATRLVRATRPADPRAPDFVKQYVSIGAGPRAGQFLILSAKARAVMEGRLHVSCADVKRAALPVLRHRIYTNFAADSEGVTSVTLIQRLLEAVGEPGPEDY